MALRAAAPLLVALMSCTPELRDPGELLAEHAAPDDIDCGVVGLLRSPVAGGRECVLGAMNAGRPFRVLIDNSFESVVTATGRVHNGSELLELSYSRVYRDHGFTEGADENIEWRSCSILLDLGPSCDRLNTNLCLLCFEPSEQWIE